MVVRNWSFSWELCAMRPPCRFPFPAPVDVVGGFCLWEGILRLPLLLPSCWGFHISHVQRISFCLWTHVPATPVAPYHGAFAQCLAIRSTAWSPWAYFDLVLPTCLSLLPWKFPHPVDLQCQGIPEIKTSYCSRSTIFRSQSILPARFLPILSSPSF